MKKLKTFIAVFVMVVLGMGIMHNLRYNHILHTEISDEAYIKVKSYAKEHNLDMYDYPLELLKLMSRNSETEDFVLSYPEEKDKIPEIDLGDISFDHVPLFMQWDKRWGYRRYSGEFAALSGCGPVCLSMAAVYTLENTAFHPSYMIDFATENGYSTVGSGSLHSLIYEGGEKLGMKIQGIGLYKSVLTEQLEKKNAVICLMGPGDFTKKGHFVVCSDIEDGKLRVNDPNSLANSENLWDIEAFLSQVRSAWTVIKYE